MAAPWIPSSSLLRSFSKLTRSSQTSICLSCRTQRRLAHFLDPDADPDLDSRVKQSKTLRTPESLHQRYKDGELIPKPLKRPLGLQYPPRPGENTGRDKRTWREKRNDWASYEKHIERQKEIVLDVTERNYYRDIGNVGKIHRGKSIIAPTTPFRSSVAMYFPNLEGQSLAVPWPLSEYRDTTPVLKNHVSILALYNNEFASRQCKSFTSAKDNPELHDFLKSYAPARDGNLARFVNIQVEQERLKAWAVRTFWPLLRKTYPKEEWDTYFLVRSGLSYEIRDAMGMWNSKVGYVYLVDGQCRIRWAGNGDARDHEKTSLVSCLKRLVDEARGVQTLRVRREDPRPIGTIQESGPAKQMPAAV